MLRMMIAEDEYIVRDGLLNHIDWQAHGVEVVFAASNGIEAAEAMDVALPDVVLTDIKMPGMNGLELGRLLYEKYPEVYVIYLTGYGEFEYAREALKLEAADYLLKPVDENDLFKRLTIIEERILERCRQEEDYADLRKAFEEARLKQGSPAVGERITRHCSKTVEDIKTYIKENYMLNIDLESVSNKFYISASYLSRLFSSESGMSFTEFLTKCRLDKAIELMANPEYKLYAISEMVGYKNVKYFTRVFSKALGIPPQEYRKHSIFDN